MSRKMRITRRVTNVRRHTQGYIINGRFYNVRQARSLARDGTLANVRVVGNHIQATNGSRRLGDLPVDVRR